MRLFKKVEDEYPELEWIGVRIIPAIFIHEYLKRNTEISICEIARLLASIHEYIRIDTLIGNSLELCNDLISTSLIYRCHMIVVLLFIVFLHQSFKSSSFCS